MSKTCHTQSTRCSQSAVYTQSPLRNITAQDDQQTSQSAPSTTKRASLGRSNTQRVSLRDAIFSALGSGEPVELLPPSPRRSHLLSDRASNSPTIPRRESSKELAARSNETPCLRDTEVINPPSLEEATPDAERRPESWTIDDVVYKTPAGTGVR